MSHSLQKKSGDLWLPDSVMDERSHVNSAQERFWNDFTDNYRRIIGRFDAADAKDRHWNRVDALSANAAASPEVRKKLRERARYEIKNNSYGQGIVDTIANECVGPGVRLQFGHKDPEVNNYVEAQFNEWCEEIGFAEKCLLMRKAKLIDGESFALFGTNDALEHCVKLDLALLETEQVAAPYFNIDFEPNYIDGIRINGFGTPISYDVLKYHPGDTFYNTSAAFGEYDTVKAHDVIHYYMPNRPRQTRGIPEVTPALPLFGQLRRVTLAVARAFEIAADIAGIIRTTNLNLDPASTKLYDRVPFFPGMLMTLPEGWTIEQFNSSQPVSTYKMFKDEVICEIIRCLNVPYNVGAGRSDGYNYASGRMDFQTFQRWIAVERKVGLEARVLNRTFRRWRHESILVDPRMQRISNIESAPFGWLFDNSRHVDPFKEAQAAVMRVNARLTSRAIEVGSMGYDVEEVFDQIEREEREMERRGIKPVNPGAPSPSEDEEKLDNDNANKKEGE